MWILSESRKNEAAVVGREGGRDSCPLPHLHPPVQLPKSHRAGLKNTGVGSCTTLPALLSLPHDLGREGCAHCCARSWPQGLRAAHQPPLKERSPEVLSVRRVPSTLGAVSRGSISMDTTQSRCYVKGHNPQQILRREGLI